MTQQNSTYNLLSQIETFNKFLNQSPLENSELGNRLRVLKTELERFKILIKQPLNVGVIGNSNSEKSELVNEIFSLNGDWKISENNNEKDVCISFSENNFYTENDLTELFCQKNISITVFSGDKCFEQLENIDLAIIVIKAEEYAIHSQLLNYIVENKNINIPIIIAFTNADGFDNVSDLCEKYQKFEDLFFIKTKKDSRNEVAKIVRLIRHFVNPDKNALGNDKIKIEEHRNNLINEHCKVLKPLLSDLKNQIEKEQKNDCGFQIDKIAKSSESQNLKKHLITNLENQYGKYIAEIDNSIFQVNRAENIGQIDSMRKELKNKNSFEHHIENAESFYSDYKDKFRDLIEKQIGQNSDQSEMREQLKTATESAFINSLDIDFENIYKPLNISSLGKFVGKTGHYIKLAIKNIISIVSNPSVLIAVVIGVAVIFALTWFLGQAQTWPFSYILDENMQASVTKAVMFLIVILSVLILLVIVWTTRKNRKIAFNNYKTQTINQLNALKKSFPRSKTEENIDKVNKKIIAEIQEVERNFNSETQQKGKQMENLLDLTVNLLDNL